MLTGIARAIRHKLADPDRPNSFSNRRRAVRFKELVRRFPELEAMRVLDMGGTPQFWRAAPVRPAHVTLLNLDKYEPSGSSWIHPVTADACEIASLASCSGPYDLVISNSVIEHVGGHQRRRDFARVVEEAAPAHWVQTPDRYFPIEPHYLAPGFQFLPIKVRAELVSRWPFAHERVYTTADALAQVCTIELIGATELQFLFPLSSIWHERVAGLSKSIVAIKTG